MSKRSYFFNNVSSELLRITELRISLPPGTYNLFELNDELNYEQIDFSVKHGTLKAAIENGLCQYVADPINQHSLTSDVILRNPIQMQTMPSRTRFTAIKVQDSVVFDSVDDSALFGDAEIKPARELEIELKNIDADEKIEATIKQANLQDRPIENRYVTVNTNNKDAQAKIKNDISMGYVTCKGRTTEGKQCMRRAKKDKDFCGLHSKK